MDYFFCKTADWPLKNYAFPPERSLREKLTDHPLNFSGNSIFTHWETDNSIIVS